MKSIETDSQFSVAEIGLSTLDIHKNISSVESPYWAVMETEPQPMYECYSRGGLVTRIANISGFTPEEMADITQSGFNSYLFQGTFGDLPVDNPQEVEAVLRKMLSGFSPTQTLVSIYDALQKKVVGGCIVNLGEGDRSVRESVGQPDSRLATLYSYHFNQDLLPNIPEGNAVCYTRFWMSPNDELLAFLGDRQNLALYKRLCVSEILSGMARASWFAAAEHGREYGVGLFDTIDKGVLNTVVKHYGAEEINDLPVPTEAVRSPNPLHWHFDKPAYIGVFDPHKQLELALRVDGELGPKTIVDWNDYRK